MILKNYIPAIFIILFPYSTSIKDCSKVKTGSFFYYSKATGSKVLIERRDSIQIETNVNLNKVLRSKVVWKDNCSFDLFVNSLSEAKLDSLDSILAKNPARVQILSIEQKFYVSKSKIDIDAYNFHLEVTDTMYFAK